MADVRSLLRSEIASRKHSSSKTQTTSGRKRKADEDLPEDRKKTKTQRSTNQESNKDAPFQPIGADAEVEGTVQDVNITPREAQTTAPRVRFAEEVQVQELESPPQTQRQVEAHGEREVDEDEWAAFEAGIAQASSAASEQLPATTISAAPITAEELAARAREEESKPKKGRRDEEMEEEKEDARRALEEEFEEMDELEERVKRLRERREALRGGDTNDTPAQPSPNRDASSGTDEILASAQEDSEDESDEEDDDWNWGRR